MRKLLVFALLLAPAVAPAQSSPLVANRPGFLDAASVVEPKRVHLESGGAYATIRTGSDRATTTGAPMQLRVGIAGGWEVRLSDGFTQQSSGAETISGVVDASAAVVRQLVTGDGLIPSAIVLVETSMPTGTQAFRARGLQPNARFALGWSLPGNRTLSIGGGTARLETATGHEVTAMGGIAASQTFSSRLGAFVEMSSPQVHFNGISSPMVARTGMAFLVSDDLQLDFDLAHGLTAANRGMQFNMGFAFRR